MGAWAAVIHEWFDKGYISRAEIVSETTIRIVPGHVENFGFHFSRELIPIVGDFTSGIVPELKWAADADGGYSLGYDDWQALSPSAKEAFEAFRSRAR